MPLPYGRGQNKHFYGTRQNVSNEMEFVSPADCSDKVDNSAESTHELFEKLRFQTAVKVLITGEMYYCYFSRGIVLVARL